MTKEQKIMLDQGPVREESKGWSTTTKVVVGLGSAALVSAVIYFGVRKTIWSKVIG